MGNITTNPQVQPTVLHVFSETQRLSFTMENGAVLLNKEWRKTVDDEWRVGKGIRIPTHVLKKLAAII